MRGNDEKVVEIEIERLHDFKNHPFKVQADSQMKELQDSISKYGILNPLIVRPKWKDFTRLYQDTEESMQLWSLNTQRYL